MKTTFPLPLRARAALGATLMLTVVFASIHLLRAAEKAPAASAVDLTHSLEGTWVHVGEPGKIGAPPRKGGFIKLRTTHHWAAIAIDPATGLVTSTHGGTWRLKGNEYEEAVEYGNEYHAQIINQTWRWKLSVEGDTMTKKGINNEWHEVWKRVK